MRALLRPLVQTPHSREMPVVMVNRTSRDKITVELPNKRFTAVHRFQLRSEDGRREIGADEFNRLPWRGAGKDPLTLSTARLFNDEVRP